MTDHLSHPSRDDVLDAFAVEPRADRGTLERYLREYPAYAAELVDLSRELAREACGSEEMQSAKDQALIDQAWRRHVKAAPKIAADPLASLSIEELRALAKHLDVPRQVITAFRERRVDVASVPQRFLAQLAAATSRTLEGFVGALTLPAPFLARSYKSDARPVEGVPVAFEQLLIEAGVTAEKRALLMASDD